MVTNRIGRSDANGGFGLHPVEGGEDVSITVADCFPMDGDKYKGYVWDGDKIEAKGKEPHTLGYFLADAMRRIELFFLPYGDERKGGRMRALRHLRNPHGESPNCLRPTS